MEFGAAPGLRPGLAREQPGLSLRAAHPCTTWCLGMQPPGHRAPRLGRWPAPPLPLPAHPDAAQDMSDKQQSKILPISIKILI